MRIDFQQLRSASQLREAIEITKAELSVLEGALSDWEQRCEHSFSKAEYCPIYKPAYTIPGDVPGTMGIDHRGPVEVPAKTIDQWKRTCNKCGKTETTKKSNRPISDPQPVF